MDQQHFGEFLLRQQMMHAASLTAIHPALTVAVPPPVDRGTVDCQVSLLNAELWRSFHEIGTEMIITKGGRRMFPSLRVSISGLDPREEYYVLLELALVGRRRLRWAGGAWAEAGGAEPQSSRRLCAHPDGPASGAHWNANPVSFGKVKLTNNTMDSQGHMVLTSMHKYRPRVLVVRAADAAGLAWGAPHAAHSFPETEFIAVTAYQNDRITKLKIDNNPFAKGFRACGQSKCKRKSLECPNENEEKSDGSPALARKRLCSISEAEAPSSSSSEDGISSPSVSPSPPSPVLGSRACPLPTRTPPLHSAYGEGVYGLPAQFHALYSNLMPGFAGFPGFPVNPWSSRLVIPAGATPPMFPTWSTLAAEASLDLSCRAMPRPPPPTHDSMFDKPKAKSFTIRSLIGES